MPTPPAGPYRFRRDPNNAAVWCIASHHPLVPGDTVQVEKRNGDISDEIVGSPNGRNPNTGHYLYAIGKASRWQKKYAGGSPIIDDLI